MGSPGKVRAERDNRVANRVNALVYNRNATGYAQGNHRAWAGQEFQDWMAATKARLTAELDAE